MKVLIVLSMFDLEDFYDGVFCNVIMEIHFHLKLKSFTCIVARVWGL